MKFNLIVMIGYRGSGKSTLARSLARRLKWDYLSSDQLIENEVGPISKWIPEQGWSAFRAREHRVCQELHKKTHSVIDLGGGAVEDQENLIGFVDHAIIFWIDADIEVLIKRLQRDKHRPLLSLSTDDPFFNINIDKTNKTDRSQSVIEETQRKYQERLPLYQKFAHHRIENNRNKEASLRDILHILKKHHTIN